MGHQQSSQRNTRSSRRWRVGVTVVLSAMLAVAAPVAASAGPAPAGSAGIGDDYFPLAGNGGYNVRHYGLDVRYSPADDKLTGLAVITATAKQSLSSFNLDLDGMTVTAVTVNGRAAAVSRSGGEMTITPRSTLRKNLPFITTVKYSGVPQTEPDGSGFLHTDDGALVVGQPRVASTWFPVNDHPADKALYTIRITVPKGLEAISNGRLVSNRVVGDQSTWVWDTDEPMASYLATATIGEFDVHSYSADGVSYWDAVDSDLVETEGPHTGSSVAYSGQGDFGYKRLQRTIAVDPTSPELSFWVDRDTEQRWDFAFVEVAPTGTDEWTTLPDVGGFLTQDVPKGSCLFLLEEEHPFLAHYLSVVEDAPCAPTGTTGQWWAATGASDGWEQWRFDLSAYAAASVDVSITYVTDYTVSLGGVAVDDIESAGGGSTGFEDDGDAWDGWTVPGPPAGSPGNESDWTLSAQALPSLGAIASASLARQPEILAFLEGYFGDYPFDELGGIVDDYPDLGFALENQTRPIYAFDFFSDSVTGDAVVVHEMAHQWYGDSVALERWADIWLNEGFATYAEWLWSEHEGTATPQQIFDYYYSDANHPAGSPFWSVIIGDPGPNNLFHYAVYERGAMTLQALRNKIGDDAFFALLPAWHDSRKGGNGTTAEFIGLAEKISGQQLDEFFDAWLYTGTRPEIDGSTLRSTPTTQLKLPPELRPHGE